MSTNDIQKLNPEKDEIASFYGLDSFAIAIRASSFDVLEEMQIIIDLCRDPDPRISLPALKHFRSIMKDVATLNGIVGNVQQSITYNREGPEVVKHSVVSQSLLSNIKDENDRTKNPTLEENKEYIPAEITSKKEGDESSD
jgi:hypothetical protein